VNSAGLSFLPLIHIYINLSQCYLNLNEPDSALRAFNTMIDKSNAYLGIKNADSTLWKIRQWVTSDARNSWAMAFAQRGAVEEGLKKQTLAEASYKEGIKYYFSYPQFDNQYFLMRLYINLANLYLKMGRADSSIRYASIAFQTSGSRDFLHYELSASKILSDAFGSKKEPDSVVKYLRRMIAINDKIFGQSRLRQFQSIGFAEEQRQKEIDTAKERFTSQMRFYGVLGALGVFLLIAFILYRNNRQKQKANVLLNKQKIDIENAMDSLKATQKQLIQAEKMASLGELTAGIAHEIQNPLNFVNNFSEVNTELFDEMQQEFRDGKPNDAFEIANDIRQNLEKISQHGKRADAIVKGMLMHSRISTGQKEPTDLNALAEEYLKIGYHGMRARDKSFNCEIQTNLDSNIGKPSLVQQDMGRVLMNLYNNAFYSLTEKKKRMDGIFNPLIEIRTRKNGDHVEISIRDNGMGIPREVTDKIFQPFFTTKPTGQGTGLGLSLSYDIITKEHGGKINLETVEGEYAEFIMILPYN
jgi:two-component system, NtrC family, sensor kinase